MVATASSAGISDDVFLSDLRDELEDQPTYSPVTFNGDGATTVFQVLKSPIWDGDVYGASPGTWQITVGGVQQSLVDSRGTLAGAGGGVFVDYPTGMLYFATPPPSGANNIVVKCSRVRWLDRRLRLALYDGLHAMFPRVWQWQTDTSLTTATNQWDYALPAVFWDPRVRLLNVSVREIPSATNRYIPISNWSRRAQTTLQLPGSQMYSPGATIAIDYCGPYNGLGDLEGQVQHLPRLYAKGVLLMNKEVPRARADVLAVTANEQANPPMNQINIGRAYMNQFETELARLSRPMPMGPMRSTYGR